MTYEIWWASPHRPAQAIIARVMTESAVLTAQRKGCSAGRRGRGTDRLRNFPLTALPALPGSPRRSPASTTTVAQTMVRPAVGQADRPVTTGALAALALIAGLVIGSRKSAAGSTRHIEVVYARLALGDSTKMRAIDNLRLAISPTGQRIAFIGSDGPDNALWVRDLNSPAPPAARHQGRLRPFLLP
jgi:hypothetical protein